MMLFAIVRRFSLVRASHAPEFASTAGDPGRTSFQATVHRNMNAWLGPVWVSHRPSALTMSALRGQVDADAVER